MTKKKIFLFISPSIDDAVKELDDIFLKSLTKDTTGEERAYLYRLDSSAEKLDVDSFVDDITNDDNAAFVKSWLFSEIEPFEDALVDFMEKRSLLQEA